MTDDSAVLFNDVAEVLVRFREGVLDDDVDEQDAAMYAFAELFATRAASACPICATRRAALLN